MSLRYYLIIPSALNACCVQSTAHTVPHSSRRRNADGKLLTYRDIQPNLKDRQAEVRLKINNLSIFIQQSPLDEWSFIDQCPKDLCNVSIVNVFPTRRDWLPFQMGLSVIGLEALLIQILACSCTGQTMNYGTW